VVVLRRSLRIIKFLKNYESKSSTQMFRKQIALSKRTSLLFKTSILEKGLYFFILVGIFRGINSYRAIIPEWFNYIITRFLMQVKFLWRSEIGSQLLVEKR